MKTYLSCFIGIPLPKEFQPSFEQVLFDMKALMPAMTPVYPQTPHITSVYLGNLTAESIERVYKAIMQSRYLLQDTILEIQGLGCFTKQNPRVIFLTVHYQHAFVHFHSLLQKKLRNIAKPDDKEYHPHLTIGRLKSAKAQEEFLNSMHTAALTLDSIHWQFQITQATIYGIDTLKQPQHQEQLMQAKIRQV